MSNIVVWSSAADLIADHQMRRPITVAYGRSPTRAFDNCFENYDGDEVATAILRRSRKNARLAANLQRYLSLASIEAAAERLADVPTRKLPEVARQTRARRQAESDAWLEQRCKANAGTSSEMPLPMKEACQDR